MKNMVACIIILCTLAFNIPFFSFAQEEGFGPPQDEPQAMHGKQRRGRGKMMIFHFIKKEMPELAEKIENEKKTNPVVFRSFIKRMGHNEFRMMGLRKSKDPEHKQMIEKLISMELESFVLGSKYKAMNDSAAKEEIQNNLKALLNDIFEIKETFQYKMIKHMETRIDKVKELIDKRREMKENIILDRLKDITFDEEEQAAMRW